MGVGMPVTLHDLARKLGVSVATVSRALSGAPGVAEETRRRIVEAAEAMQYRPNVLAQRLQKQRTDTIGFIIPTFGPRFSDPFFSELLAGIGNEAAVHEYDLLVSTRPPGEEEMIAYERMVQERRVDGLLVVRTRRHDPRIEYLQSHHFPFVAFGRCEAEEPFPYVDVDGEAGMYRLTHHLIAKGHRRIAYITVSDALMFSHYRIQGYRRALEEAGLPFDAELIVEAGMSDEEGFRAGQALLRREPPPTAIIAATDLIALGVMGAAESCGVQVGSDLAVAGFDDISLASLAHPPLTTLRQPIYAIGQTICRMLLERILQGTIAEPYRLLQPELIVRASTDFVYPSE